MTTTTTKKLYRETPFPELGVWVITAKYNNHSYETEVVGGKLDGWPLTSKSERQADRTHKDVCEMVRGADKNEQGAVGIIALPPLYQFPTMLN